MQNKIIFKVNDISKYCNFIYEKMSSEYLINLRIFLVLYEQLSDLKY